jgi:hypothetical protein
MQVSAVMEVASTSADSRQAGTLGVTQLWGWEPKLDAREVLQVRPLYCILLYFTLLYFTLLKSSLLFC